MMGGVRRGRSAVVFLGSVSVCFVFLALSFIFVVVCVVCFCSRGESRFGSVPWLLGSSTPRLCSRTRVSLFVTLPPAVLSVALPRFRSRSRSRSPEILLHDPCSLLHPAFVSLSRICIHPAHMFLVFQVVGPTSFRYFGSLVDNCLLSSPSSYLSILP